MLPSYTFPPRNFGHSSYSHLTFSSLKLIFIILFIFLGKKYQKSSRKGIYFCSKKLELGKSFRSLSASLAQMLEEYFETHPN